MVGPIDHLKGAGDAGRPQPLGVCGLIVPWNGPVRSDMKVFQEDIFGPVVAVTPFDDDDEVATLANDSTYGLAAQVWTRTSAARTGWRSGSRPA